MEPYQIDNIIQAISILLWIGGAAGGFSLVLYVRSRVAGQLPAEREQQLIDMIDQVHQAVDDLRTEQAILRDEVRRQLGDGRQP
ncbi:MAG TPA: hypothetical protein VLL51_08590 [Gemmatimonadales bacterium]|nr:hypothetical protein [Gemmatimonadales bacterium]